MSGAADTIANSWADAGEIDLDTECRRLTLRALGRSVLGLDLDERADALAEPLRIVLTYIADRGLAPVRAPKWLPTPAPPSTRRGGDHPPDRQRRPAGVPRRSDPGCAVGARFDRGHRPDGAAADRQRDL
jgi:hypothetical protein